MQSSYGLIKKERNISGERTLLANFSSIIRIMRDSLQRALEAGKLRLQRFYISVLGLFYSSLKFRNTLVKYCTTIFCAIFLLHTEKYILQLGKCQ